VAIHSTSRQTIPYLIPDMPEYYQLARYLQSTDKKHWYSNFGPLVNELELGILDRFFPGVDKERLITCSSGTAAIELAIKSLSLPAGSSILVPSFTFPATVTAIVNCGHNPVFCDVDEKSWQMTPEIAYDAMSFVEFHGVLPVATMGMPQDIDGWEQFARDTQLPVIIDAAPAIESQKVSTELTVCFSLHATKAFGVGEGGFVIYPSQEEAARGKKLSNFGFSAGVIEEVGSNYKLSEYHAAVGLAQLERWQEVVDRRDAIRRYYQSAMETIKSWVFFQSHSNESPGGDISYLQRAVFYSSCVIGIRDTRRKDNHDVVNALLQLGIEARPWYKPIHQHPAFCEYQLMGQHGEACLSVTNTLGKTLFSLPFHNFLVNEDIDYIVNGTKKSIGRRDNKSSKVIRIG